MEEPPKISNFAKCATCGKITFADLLDSDFRCEYCREVRPTPSRVLSKSKRTKAEKK